MKSLLKELVRFFARIAIVPLYVLHFVHLCFSDERRALCFYSQLLSIIPGVIGNYMRLEFYRLALKGCSSSACISFGTIFSTTKVSVGENVYFGLYCVIGESEIGNDAIIGSRVSVLSGLRQHSFEDIEIPIREQEGQYNSVRIGADTWVGEGAIVGANLGDGVIVGAGSVVVTSVDSNQIVAGNPAKFIRNRDK